MQECIQTIGEDIFFISELPRKNFRQVGEQIPTTFKRLIELGASISYELADSRR